MANRGSDILIVLFEQIYIDIARLQSTQHGSPNSQESKSEKFENFKLNTSL